MRFCFLAGLLALSWASCRDFGQFEPIAGNSGSPSAGGGGTGGEVTGGGEMAVGGSGGSGGQASVPCGTTDLLSDAFDDSSLSESWLVDNQEGLVAWLAGELVMDVDDAGSDVEWQTTFGYSMRDRGVSVEVTSVTGDATGRFEIWSGNSWAEFEVHVDALVAWFGDDEDFTTLFDMPYDPVAHRHLRFRSEASLVYWETSQDGTNWTTIASLAESAIGIDIDHLYVELGLDGYDGGGEVRFDNINNGAPPAGVYCPVSDLSYDFSGSEWSEEWAIEYSENGSCDMDLVAGQLHAIGYADSGDQCGRAATHGYDMTGQSVSIELIQAPPDPGGTSLAFSVFHPQLEDAVGIALEDDLIVAFRLIDDVGQDLMSTPFDPAETRYARMLEQGGLILFQTSPDGTTWNTLTQTTPSFDPANIGVGFELGVDFPSTDETSIVDNINIIR